MCRWIGCQARSRMRRGGPRDEVSGVPWSGRSRGAGRECRHGSRKARTPPERLADRPGPPLGVRHVRLPDGQEARGADRQEQPAPRVQEGLDARVRGRAPRPAPGRGPRGAARPADLRRAAGPARRQDLARLLRRRLRRRADHDRDQGEDRPAPPPVPDRRGARALGDGREGDPRRPRRQRVQAGQPPRLEPRLRRRDGVQQQGLLHPGRRRRSRAGCRSRATRRSSTRSTTRAA